VTRTVRDFNPNEARDPDGKWTSGGGIPGKGYHPARKTSAGDWSASDLADVVKASTPDWTKPFDYSRDEGLLAMWRKQGFTGKPTVVSAEEFDALGPDHVKVYRGLRSSPKKGTADEFAEQFRTGDEPFPGIGGFGNGTYSSTDLQNASSYMSGSDATVLRMALRPDARIATYRDLDDAIFGGLPELSDEARAVVEKDAGRLATLLGYDAVKERNQVVILNRTAVIVQEAA